MSTELFYFSGTGNSLFLAKLIASRIGDAKITKIIYTDECEIVSNAENVGIIYPVYAFNMPKIVNAFLQKLKVTSSAYVFAIGNCAGFSGAAMLQTRQILETRQIQLQFGAMLLMPSNYLPFGGAEAEKKVKKKAKLTERKLETIIKMIKEKRRGEVAKTFLFPLWLSKLSYSFFCKGIAKEIKKFSSDDKCVSCGICTRVCPASNIRMVENIKKPEWGTNCELCMACIQWCPAHAVQWGNIPPERARYHHPDIKVEEMFYR